MDEFVSASEEQARQFVQTVLIFPFFTNSPAQVGNGLCVIPSAGNNPRTSATLASALGCFSHQNSQSLVQRSVHHQSPPTYCRSVGKKPDWSNQTNDNARARRLHQPTQPPLWGTQPTAALAHRSVAGNEYKSRHGDFPAHPWPGNESGHINIHPNMISSSFHALPILPVSIFAIDDISNMLTL